LSRTCSACAAPGMASRNALAKEEAREGQKTADALSHVVAAGKHHSALFAENDVDGDQHLDYEEFLAMLPESIRSSCTPHQIRSWFNTVDADQSGAISINEFFMWTMANSAAMHGATALKSAFEHYDKDNKGTLDAEEFEALAQDLGFQSVAYDIFKALDGDTSGSLRYREMVPTLCDSSKVPADALSKSLLLSLVYAFDGGGLEVGLVCGQKCVDTSGWVIRGADAASIRKELQQLLSASGAHVVDLVKVFDIDATNALTIDDVEQLRGSHNAHICICYLHAHT